MPQVIDLIPAPRRKSQMLFKLFREFEVGSHEVTGERIEQAQSLSQNVPEFQNIDCVETPLFGLNLIVTVFLFKALWGDDSYDKQSEV